VIEVWKKNVNTAKPISKHIIASVNFAVRSVFTLGKKQ
jgi:hypothetical protein